jgi:hypothetical protein
MADTSRLLLPSLRFFIASPQETLNLDAALLTVVVSATDKGEIRF